MKQFFKNIYVLINQILINIKMVGADFSNFSFFFSNVMVVTVLFNVFYLWLCKYIFLYTTINVYKSFFYFFIMNFIMCVFPYPRYLILYSFQVLLKRYAKCLKPMFNVKDPVFLSAMVFCYIVVERSRFSLEYLTTYDFVYYTCLLYSILRVFIVIVGVSQINYELALNKFIKAKNYNIENTLIFF